MKTCIVTGGASGIGLATTRVLLDEGWHVAVFDRDRDALDRVRQALVHPDVAWHRVDIADESAVEDAVGLVARGGALEGLVNNAAIGVAKPFFETTADDMRRLYEVNVVGTFVVSRAVASHMRDTGRGGAIVNLASTAGQQGNHERSAYGASKGAVVVLTQVMAIELAASRIRVNAVSPGPVATPLVDAMHTDAMRARWTALTPQHRYADPGEIAHAIAFLLDPVRASFVTGHVLNVDGGLLTSGLLAP